MRIESVRIQNFRCYADQTVNFDSYTCLVGPNGAGKSSVLGALNVVFRDSSAHIDSTLLRKDDFHHKNTAEPIRITVRFTDLSDAACADLKAYVRHGVLSLTAIAEWNEEQQHAEVRQVGSRLVMKDFREFFEAFDSGAKVAELRTIYGKLRSSTPSLPAASTKDAMRGALRQYEEENEDLCEPTESRDEFYGWSKGSNLLERHFQWVYVSAIKNPADEQDETRGSALGKLLQRTIRSRVDFSARIGDLLTETAEKYKQILADEGTVLDEIGAALASRLQEWSHPTAKVALVWKYDQGKSVRVEEPMARVHLGEGKFLGDLVRLGHGVQRSFLVAILHELVSAKSEGEPTLVLAIEEPELFQHPPQARHFSTVLERLANEGAQVVVTTHSPYFVSGRGFESVRMTRKHTDEDDARVSQLTHSDLTDALSEALGTKPTSPSTTMAALEQILQPSQSELFFSRVPVFVEGVEDIAFIASHLKLTGRWDRFRQHGCHFVPCSGKVSMSRPVAIANGLGLPYFCVFDGDKQGVDQGDDSKNNDCLLRLCGEALTDPAPQVLWGHHCTMWPNKIRPTVIEGFGGRVWEQAEAAARTESGYENGVKGKHPLLIAATLEGLASSGQTSAILEQLCDQILTHAESSQ